MDIQIKEVAVPEVFDLLGDIPEKHRQEAPFGPFQLELDLNTLAYTHAYNEGFLRCLCAYDGDTLVGYMSIMCGPDMKHTGMYQCMTEAYYVDPEYRQAGVFDMLLRVAERLCKEHGVRFLSVTVNPMTDNHEALTKHLEKDGYHTTEYTLTKEL